VTRDIPALISKSGFKLEQIEAGYVSPFPKSGSYCWWGVAHSNSLGRRRRYTGRTSEIQDSGLEDSFACGRSGESLSDH
jgi:hypothetical protein